MNKDFESIFDGVRVATIDRYPDYIFFDSGFVLSLKRKRFVGYDMPNGYKGATLTDKDGNERFCYIHRLIWEAFNGAIPRRLTINHNNEMKNDNRLSNLCLMTYSQNINFGTRNERAAAAMRRYW